MANPIVFPNGLVVIPNGTAPTFAVDGNGNTYHGGPVALANTVTFTSTLLGPASTSAFGYTTGSGGTVTQGTSKSTGVTLNTINGAITMNNAALLNGAKVSFTVTNSTVGANDNVVVSVASGGTADAYRADVCAIGSGSFDVAVENITGGSLSESPVIKFTVLKGANS